MNNIATFLRESRMARALIPMGLIFIIFSVIMFVVGNNQKNYIPTQAIVTKTELVEAAHTDADGEYIEATYKVYVKYKVEEKEYEEELGELSGYKKGDKVKIVYNPENPSQISQPSSLIITIILLVAGLAALIGGIISAITGVKKHKALKKQEEGWKNGK